MEEKQAEEEEKRQSRRQSQEKGEAEEEPGAPGEPGEPGAQEAQERPGAQERRRTLSQTPSLPGAADALSRGSRVSLGAPLSPRGSLPQFSPRGSLPQLSPRGSLPQLSPRGSLPQLSPSQISPGVPGSLGSLGAPGEEEAEGELKESASKADSGGLRHLVGTVPSQVSMPEAYGSLEGGQYGLFQPVDFRSNMFQPEPVLSSSSFLAEEEEGSHGPYAMDDPRYRGSHMEPGFGPMDYELPEPEPRELMIQNAKAYLLKTSVKCDLSL